MQKIPKLESRRFVCRSRTKYLDGYYWVMMFDQCGMRYPEADYKTENYEESQKVARHRANRSFCAEDTQTP